MKSGTKTCCLTEPALVSMHSETGAKLMGVQIQAGTDENGGSGD